VVAAHYDHIGEFDGDIHPGANDNAAAVAVMLDVVERWRHHDSALDRSLLFCAFDAEEPPYFLTEQMGSIHFVDHPTIPLDQIDVMICMDLVGVPLGPEGLPDEVRQSIFVLGGESAEGLGTVTQNPAMRTWGINPRRLDSYVVPPMSDYYAFQQVGIPHIFLSGGRNRDYHQPSDTADKVNYRRLEALSTYVADLVGDLSLAHGDLAPVSGGVGDRVTVETLMEMAQLLSTSIPEAGQAMPLLDELSKKIENGEALDSNDRSVVQVLVGLLEQAMI
jgi:Zn-dependent M28 family amino/carboxypeptidase